MRAIGVAVALIGVLSVGAGVFVWSMVASSLRAERVTVSQDAPALVGSPVDTPWEAWAQAQALTREQAGATGGATISRIAVGNPQREGVLESTMLRSALYGAVTSFGLAGLSIVVGVALVLLGVALTVVARSLARTT